MSMARSPYEKQIRSTIRQYGRAVLGISDQCGPECLGHHPGHFSAPPDETFVPFCYTIGNTEKQLPELLLIYGDKLLAVLNTLSDVMIKRRRRFDHGEVVDIGAKVPCMVIDTDERAFKYTIQARGYYGTGKYTVQQVLVPDPQGRFPFESECDRPYRDMPVLGVPPVRH